MKLVWSLVVMVVVVVVMVESTIINKHQSSIKSMHYKLKDDNLVLQKTIQNHQLRIQEQNQDQDQQVRNEQYHKLILDSSEQSEQGQQEQIEQIFPKVPIQDTREFYLNKLPNELEMMIIRDQDLKQTHVSLSVNIGSFLESNQIPGLAHFLEHMLFMGSQKYPKVSEFTDCISLYQGSSNAQTEDQMTTFYFDIQDKGFIDCLDIFAQFFISPLFDQDNVQKEIEAVDSEYQNQLQGQGQNSYFAFKTILNPKHPMSRFNCGNKETLNQTGIVDQLKQFHDHYYSSNLMKLVIITSQDQTEVFHKVKHMFQKIPNKQIDRTTLYDFKQKLFMLNNQVIRYKAKEKVKQVQVYFELPEQITTHHKKSIEYILNFFNNNGPESFMRYLKEQNYVYSFFGLVFDSTEQYCLLEFMFDFTDSGFEKRNHVLSIFFSYLKKIREDNISIQEDLYIQKKMIEQSMFQVSQKQDDIVYISQQMHIIKQIENIFYHSHDYQQFDIQDIKKYLEKMKPESAQFAITKEDYDFSRLIKVKGNEQRYYNKLYELYFLKQEFNLNIDENISLEKEFEVSREMLNYVPKDVQKVNQQPQLLKNTETLKLWHLALNQLTIPEYRVDIMLYSPNTFKNAKDNALSELLEKYLNEMVLDKFYNVIELGHLYDIQIVSTIEGLYLQFSGNSEYLHNIIKDFFNKIYQNFQLEDYKFESMKQELIDIFQNNLKKDAYQQGEERLKKLILNYHYDEEQLIEQLKTFTHKQLLDYKFNFFRNIYCETLVSGVIEQKKVLQIFSDIEQFINLNNIDEVQVKNQLIDQTINNIQNQQLSMSYQNSNSDDNNHAVVTYIQYGREDIHVQSILGIIIQYMDENAFEFLRTQRQLGYIASCSNYNLNEIMGIAVLVQGTNHNTTYIRNSINEFLVDFDQKIQGLSDDKFNKMKQALKQSLLEKDTDLNSIANKYWTHILKRDYNFDKKEKLLEQLKTTTLNDLKSVLKYDSQLVFNHNQQDYIEQQNVFQGRLDIIIESQKSGVQKMDQSMSYQKVGSKQYDIVKTFNIEFGKQEGLDKSKFRFQQINSINMKLRQRHQRVD